MVSYTSTLGQGTRFVLADTGQLHAKIAEMGRRIRELEDALAIFQSSISSETHPLLSEDLLKVKFYPDRLQDSVVDVKSEHTLDSIDALGTLTIGDSGEAKYFGRSAGSETLFLAGAELDAAADDVDRNLPTIDIARYFNVFPFSGEGVWDNENAIDTLFNHLPSHARATSLCETYLEQGTWSNRPIRREELIDDILAPVYKQLKQRQDHVPVTPVSPHRLAALFMVFSLGALVDLTLPPDSAEAQEYYHLARAALSLRSMFDSPEINTVQALLLMAAFHTTGNRRYTTDGAWLILSLTSKLAQSMGLHRDSARWNLDPKTIQRRRQLFWEIFTADLFHSLALGRPPSIRMSYVDCEYPQDETEKVGENGEVLIGFYHWKYDFTKDVFSAMTELTLTAEPPSYQTILELDRKVRERRVPPHLQAYVGPDDTTWTPLSYMRGYLLTQFRAITLLYIHRSFFAQAMLDHPINPLRSPFAPSFLAAYRCASGLIKLSIQHHNRIPDLCVRWWPFWTHLFSAAIIVGAIVTRAPSSSMASAAYVELGLACDLFRKGNQNSPRVRSGMAILAKLQERAHKIYSQFQAGNTLPHIDYSVRQDHGEDELAIFGGQTRVLASRLLSKRSHARRADQPPKPSSQLPSSPASSDESRSPTAPLPDVHPLLVEYLSLLPNSQNDNPSSEFSSPTPVEHINFPTQIETSMFSLPMAQQSGQYVAALPSFMSPPQSHIPIDQLSLQSPMAPCVGGGLNTSSQYAQAPLGIAQNGNDQDNTLADLGLMMSAFRAPHPEARLESAHDIDLRNPSRHMYSRYTQQVSTRAEHILSQVNALVFFKPKRIAITGGYHGCHQTIAVYAKSRGVDIPIIDLDADFQSGDLCWLETPLNPTGESRDISYYADKAHVVGAKLLVDSTFGPPPLQYPFEFGADCILHSATKYFGGHSDMLGGILVVKTEAEWNTLHTDRTYLGNMMGSLEAWLLLRSLRTLHLRVPRQSETATKLAHWLKAAAVPAGRSVDGIPGGVIEQVWHSSFQGTDTRGFNPAQQMTGGWNATFSLILHHSEHAALLPHTVKYFVPATSLGGVESLMEQRVQSDPGADPRLIRISVGVEDLEDLKSDLRQAFQVIHAREKSKL
ncbi:hypothetical protein ONZ45_g55 [Pleurotus djamor]|nr:hypothetical protein ONZ45_g55 [Pleurotus djamor]